MALTTLKVGAGDLPQSIQRYPGNLRRGVLILSLCATGFTVAELLKYLV